MEKLYNINKPVKKEKLVKSLSYSKINSWLTNRKQFIKTYFEKEPFFETSEILFGKLVWTMIELGETSDKQLLMDRCLMWFDGVVDDDQRKSKILSIHFDNIKKSNLPTQIAELSFDLESQFETKLQSFIKNVCVMWYADNISADMMNLKEFKTWKTTWTQDKVNNFIQLEIYCYLIKELTGKIPDNVELIWIETVNNEQWDVVPTWKIERFEYVPADNIVNIFKWSARIPKIFAEIQEAQEEWENQKQQEDQGGIEEMLILDLYSLTNKIEKLQEEEKMIRERIREDMLVHSVEKFELPDIGAVYFMDKKIYDYPWEIQIQENLLKKEYEEKGKVIKAMKKEYEETVTPEINKILVFKKVKWIETKT